MVSTTERKGRRSGAPGTRLLSLAGVKITKAWVDAVYPGFRDGGGGGGEGGESKDAGLFEQIIYYWPAEKLIR